MRTLEHLVHFGRLKDRLLRGGIAPRHVRRTLIELHDHYDDVFSNEQGKGLDAVAAAQAAWVRLGDEEQLAQTILARPELHSLTARFPGIIFGSGPLLLWIAAIVLSVFGIMSSIDLLKSMKMLPPPGTPEPQWVYGPTYAVCFFYARILPLVIGALMMFGAMRQRLPLRWPIIGIAIVSLFGGTTDITVKLVTQVGEHGELTIGNTLLPLLIPIPDAVGPFHPAEFAQGVVIGVLNVAIILTPLLTWGQRHKLYNTGR